MNKLSLYGLELNEETHPVLVLEKECEKVESSFAKPFAIAAAFNAQFSLGKRAEEYSYVLALDIKLQPLGVFEVCHGLIGVAALSTREVFIRLLLCGAYAFVLIHNHPSGWLEPSDDDISATKTIGKAGKLMQIKLLDHIIIARENYYSFLEHGKMEEIFDENKR